MLRTSDKKAFRILTFNSLVGTHGDVSSALKFHFCKVIGVPVPNTRGVRVKIPQQANATDCGTVVLFFGREFLLKPEEFIQKATNRGVKEENWNFEPAKMRKIADENLSPLVTEITIADVEAASSDVGEAA